MFKTGLVSVSFRNLSPEEIIDMVKQAGLSGIEWGGDVHVPAGDIACAESVAFKTMEAGLETLAYGSYYYLGAYEDYRTEFQKVIDSAAALNAPVIRIWGGKKVSSALSKEERAALVRETQDLCDMLKGTKIALAFEFHNNTITDTAESAIRLMEEAERGNLYLYYQPNRHYVPVGESALSYCLKELNLVMPYLYHVHAYHFNAQNEKCLLEEGYSDFVKYIEAIRAAGKNPALMVEFCLDNKVENFFRDAKTIKKLAALS